MPSQYKHGYAYDFFVSYSTRNQDWVRAFHDDLVKAINALGTRDVYPFLDKDRLQPGNLWEVAMLDAARDCAILIPVLTPRFFESEPCQNETSAFVEAFGLSADAPSRTRIFPIKLLCTAPKNHLLEKAQTMEFCTVSTAGVPFPYEPGTPQYRDALQKLAYAMAQALEAMPPKEQGRPAVYVAPDFQPATDKLRASLAHNFEVLPKEPQTLISLSAEALEQALERAFSRCFASVHPMSDAPGAKSLVEAQIAFARKQKNPRLLWAATAPPDELTNAGFEWFKSQADIEDRLRRIWEKPAEAKIAGMGPMIYFLCPDRANETAAERLLEALKEGGVHVYPSPVDGPAEQALQTHVKALDELDGCLIYYGDIGREWFDSVFLRVQKKIRQRQLPSAIYVGPPPTDHKNKDLVNLGVALVGEPAAAVKTFLLAKTASGGNK